MFLLLLPLALGGCRGVETESVPAAAVDADAAQPQWSGLSESGRRVDVSPPPDPLTVGPLSFSIRSDAPPRSVDLVSPGMPMHGVLRYPVDRHADGWIAQVEIPMAGAWTLYVNFDEGGDAAAIHFAVPDAPHGRSRVADTPSAHHH